MKKNIVNDYTYKDYLTGKKKSDLCKILDKYSIEYKKNLKKEKIEKLIIDSLELIVEKVIDIFQDDELISINYVIKKKGYVYVKLNYLLNNFLDNLVSNYLMIKADDNEYQMPSDLLIIFKDKLKRKSIITKIKNNTSEHNLILGNIDAYGIIEFNNFYNNYSKIYKLTNDVCLTRIKFIASFYNEFHVIEDKKKVYIASNLITDVKNIKNYFNPDIKMAVYTNEELVDIHTFKYMKKIRSYKKLIKFIESNYDVEKGSFKIINRYVLVPYYNMNQIDETKASELITTLVDKYFEFSKEKQKNKFITLVNNTLNDYPNWLLRGHTKREKL